MAAAILEHPPADLAALWRALSAMFPGDRHHLFVEFRPDRRTAPQLLFNYCNYPSSIDETANTCSELFAAIVRQARRNVGQHHCDTMLAMASNAETRRKLVS